MKLCLKTLKNEMVVVEEVEPQTSVQDIKKKISQQKGIDIDLQKIVYKGKPLANTDTVGGLGIKENQFMVLMTLVKKPQSKPKQETEPKKQQKPKEQPTEKKQEKKETSTQNQAQINELMNMGFDRQKCVAALRAAFDDTGVAIEYLLNGIPPELSNNPQPGQQISGNNQQMLRAIIQTPEFEDVKQLLREDPSAINNVLEQIMISSPPLYNIIQQNPQAFQRILNEELGFEGQEDLQDQQEGEGHQDSIQITQAENAAIQRLMALGFSKIDAAQAYFACDKNEQMAANLLFDKMGNEDFNLPPGPGKQGGGNQDKHEQDDDNLFG